MLAGMIYFGQNEKMKRVKKYNCLSNAVVKVGTFIHSSSTFIHIHPLSSTLIPFHSFSLTFIHFIHCHLISSVLSNVTILIQFHHIDPVSSIFIHLHPLSTIFIHFNPFYPFSSTFITLLFTFIHFHPLSSNCITLETKRNMENRGK